MHTLSGHTVTIEMLLWEADIDEKKRQTAGGGQHQGVGR